MSKMTDIFDVWNFVKTNLVTGILPFVSFVFFGLYLKGYFDNKAIVRARANDEFEIKAHQFSPSLQLFNAVNSVFDFLIGASLNLVQKAAWIPCMKFMSQVLPDIAIETVMKATVGSQGIASLSFKSRLEKAEVEFDRNENEFWWNKERAPAYREISPIISGRFFNGQAIEKYLSMLVSKEDFYQVIRAGVLVFVVSLLVTGVLYRPNMTFGFTPERLVVDQASAVVKNDAVWAGSNVPEAQKVDKAIEMLTDSSYTTMANILFSLFLSFGIACLFMERAYFGLFKKLKTPFIKDNYEEFAYQVNEEDIKIHKRNLSAANIRATGYSRESPLFVSFESTGAFEEMGMVGALHQGEPIIQSADDKKQNTILTGGTGSGKSLFVLFQEILRILELKNRYLRNEHAYREIFDLRTDRLTEKAIEQGYLKEYKKLPDNPVSMAMVLADAKSQLYKQVLPYVASMHLKDYFQIFGGDVEQGQLAVDLMGLCNPNSACATLSAIGSQMGGDMQQDFWIKKSNLCINDFFNVIYVYSRTTGARDYMRKHNIKTWSLVFAQNMISFDPTYELIDDVIANIHYDLMYFPERLADIFTLDKVRSMENLLTEWRTMPQETKGGLQATMTMIMSGFDNPLLASFFTGVGENIVGIDQFWNMLTAFDFDDRHGKAGRFTLLWIKTLMYGEAISRQMRYSSKIVNATNIFLQEFPGTFEAIPALELIPVAWVCPEAQALIGRFHECCSIVKGAETTWKAGEFSFKLKAVVQAMEAEGRKDESPESVYQIALEALGIIDQVFVLEPRHAKDVVTMSGFDSSILKVSATDSEEQATRKEELLELYYGYEDATTRVQREYLTFIGDEFQQLITYTKSQECYHDGNFPPVCRSTGTNYFVATQSLGSFTELSKEVANNFFSQMRNKIFLPVEDEQTSEAVEKLAGKIDVFKNPFKNVELKDGKELTGLSIYNSFNALIYKCINNDKLSSIYPYKENIFVSCEPIIVGTADKVFSKPFSALFEDNQELSIHSMKRHFLDESEIPTYERRGSSNQGYTDNVDAIRSAWSKSRAQMNTQFQDFLTKNVEKNVPLYPASKFGKQGNIHAFVSLQIGGVQVIDQVIVAGTKFYKQ